MLFVLAMRTFCARTFEVPNPANHPMAPQAPDQVASKVDDTEDGRQEKEFYRTLVQLSPAFIVAIGADGKTVMMNDSMLRALGYLEEEVVGKDYLSTFVPEEDRELLAGIFAQIVERREQAANVNALLAKDGRKLICEWRATPVFSGKQNGFFFRVGLDITERKQMEESLLASKIFRKRIFETSRIPIGVIDVATARFVDCNPAAIHIYGFSSREEVLGKTPADISAPIQYDGTPSAEKARFYNEKALKDGAVIFEWRHMRPHGEVWDAEVHLMSFQHDGREFLQFTLLDITGRKKAEDALIQSQAQLRALSGHLEKLREDERTRISREIHDELGQMLTGIKMDLRSLAACRTEKAAPRAAFFYFFEFCEHSDGVRWFRNQAMWFSVSFSSARSEWRHRFSRSRPTRRVFLRFDGHQAMKPAQVVGHTD